VVQTHRTNIGINALAVSHLPRLSMLRWDKWDSKARSRGETVENSDLGLRTGVPPGSSMLVQRIPTKITTQDDAQNPPLPSLMHCALAEQPVLPANAIGAPRRRAHHQDSRT
jgi:hypothetical protein